MLFIFLSSSFAVSAFEVNGLYYNIISENEVEVVRPPKKYSGDIVIPATVSNSAINYAVTSIGNYAFRGCTGLTSVTIPNSVTSIGRYAFYDCTGLASVTIPNSVTSIGNEAFRGCSGLTSVIVESGNTKYDSRDNCNAIIETTSNTLIAGCKNTSIPNSVTSIGNYAFGGCTGLTSVTIPNSVTSIGDYAFRSCSGLTSVTIPNSVTSIGGGAFEGCTGLTSVTIGNSVTSIGNYAFWGCTGLTSVTIGSSVTSIGSLAFFNCAGLTSVTIPNSVTSIGEGAFSGCPINDIGITGAGMLSKSLLSQLNSSPETIRIGYGITAINDLQVSPKHITSYATMPPACTENSFKDYIADLHVPAAGAAHYFTTHPWNRFTNVDFNANERVTISQTTGQASQVAPLQLSATCNVPNGKVVWGSSNPAVAVVDSTGLVTATGSGTCHIFASMASNPCVYDTCLISAVITPFILTGTDMMHIKPNNLYTLRPDFDPYETELTVTSSNPSVVMVRVVKDEDAPVVEPDTRPVEVDAAVMAPMFAVSAHVPVEGKQRVQILGLRAGTSTLTFTSTDGTALPTVMRVSVLDINDDRSLDLGDMNILINIILGNESPDGYSERAYIDGDTNVASPT